MSKVAMFFGIFSDLLTSLKIQKHGSCMVDIL